MSIFVLNSGSSTLKFSFLDASGRRELASGLLDMPGKGARGELLFHIAGRRQRREVDLPGSASSPAVLFDLLKAEEFSDLLRQAPVKAVGHRVVHGGPHMTESKVIDAQVLAELRKLTELAPLHNPPALDGIDAARSLFNDVPHVAVFDTAFFSNLPESAYLYPVPYAWFEEWGIRRFGFHGISHAYCASRAAELLEHAAEPLRIVTCHLGNGCSAAAVQGERAVATTMGFTPMDGMMMGTRPGSLDPGMLLHVQQAYGQDAETMEKVLNKESGLLGISGIASDFREVQEQAEQGHKRARLALDMFAASVTKHVGGLAAIMGGTDALVFTAGIGEHAAGLREAVCKQLAFMGAALDPERNRNVEPDADVALPQARTRVLVIKSREETAIARDVVRLL